MSVLSQIFSGAAKDVIGEVGSVIDKLTTSDHEKSNAKQAIGDSVLGALGNVAQIQGDVIKTEMRGNWLQRSWRPILMLTFGALLVMRWTGLASYDLPLELEMKLMTIIQYSLGGYVGMRSIEKVASTLTANIDMPFLKKKDRKI